MDSYVCQICGMRYNIKNSLNRHMKRRHGTKFECDVCEEQFSTKRKLKAHISRTHNEDGFICDTCCKQFKSRKSIIQHMQIHLKEKFECNQCSKTFLNRWSLLRHLRNNRCKKYNCLMTLPEKQNDSEECSQCCKKFINKWKLLYHLRNSCNEKFNCNDTLLEKHNECEVCGEEFSTKRKLQSHYNQVHNEDSLICAVCYMRFETRKSIRRHIQIHHEKKFECNQCGEKFSGKWKLLHHIRDSCNEKSEQQNSHALKCGFCNSYFSSRKGIQQHFQTNHEIMLSRELFHFNSEEDFKQFKFNYQRKTSTQFVIRSSYRTANGITKLYKCHRSGLHKSKTRSIKFPKLKGVKKIQSYCPAEMLVKCLENGKCVVDFQKTHVGHNISDQNELGHIIYLDPNEQEIAAKIQLTVPKNTNGIKQEFTNWETEKGHKLELLNSQDVQNVAANYNIQNKFRLAFDDDLINLEAFAKMHKSSVLFFKNKSEEDTRFNALVNDDFALIFMNEFQEMSLLRYGKNIIAFDGTYGTNKYNFILHTLLVMDFNYEGIPAAFLVSNRNDDVIINIFLQCIREQVGVIVPRVIMSDIELTYSNSWVEVMQNEPNFTLWCTWHVREDWCKNYCKITDKKKREEVKRTVLNFAYELDPALFQIKLNEFLSTSDVDLTAFVTYFHRQFVKNGKSLKWAYCYRKGVGIHTDVSLESFHRSLNYYVKGKKMDWSTCTLHCIHKYLSIKVNSEDIVFYEANKLKILRQKHHEARKTTNVTSKVHVINSNSWLVESFEKQNMAYFIEKREIKECDQYKDVICRLFCDLCKICFHEYSCNCRDAVIHNNMCKHIHAVGILQCTLESHIADELCEDNSVDETIAQQTTVLSNLSSESLHEYEEIKVEETVQLQENETENIDALEKEKQDIQAWFKEMLDKIPNRQILKQIKKQFLNPIIQFINDCTTLTPEIEFKNET